VSVALDTATRTLGDAGSAPRAAEPTRRIYRNLGALGGGQAVTWLVTLGWTFIVPRILGPAGIGVIVTAISVAGIFSILLGLGTRNYLVREIVVAPDTAPRLVGTALVLRLLMVPLFCIATVAYTLVVHTPRDQTVVVYLASAAALVLLICEPYQAGFQAAERMEYLAYGDVINKTGQSLIGILLAVVGIRAVGITASWVVIALGVLVATHIWWSRLSHVTLRTTPGELGRMLRGSAAYWAFGVFFLVYLWIDTVMLSLMTNPQTVGYYGVPTRLFQTMMFLPVLISTAWLPRLVHAFEEDPRSLRAAAHQPVEVVLILGLPIGAATIIFAGPVLGILYGPPYHPAVGVMMLLGLCIPPMFLNILLNQVLIAAKRQSTWTWVMLGAMIINPLLNLALIPYTQTKYHNGALGAAASLVATEILIVALGLGLVGQHIITGSGLRRVAASAVASTAMVLAGLGTRTFGDGVSITCGVAAFVVVGAVLGLVTPRKIRDARRGLAALRGRDAPPADDEPVLAHQVAMSVDPNVGDPMWVLDGVSSSVQPVEYGPVPTRDDTADSVPPIRHDADSPPPADAPDVVPPIGQDSPSVLDDAADTAQPVETPRVSARDVPAVSVPPIRRNQVSAPDAPAVSVPPAADDSVRGLEEAVASAAPTPGNRVRALELYRDADDILRRVGDSRPAAAALEHAAERQCQIADQALAVGHRQDAVLAFGRALALARDAVVLPTGEHDALRASAEAVAGRALIGLGQPVTALDHLKIAVLTARNAGDHLAEGTYLIDTARALDAAGRRRDARSAVRRAVELLVEVGDHRTLARAREVASNVRDAAGDPADARGEGRRFHAPSGRPDGGRQSARGTSDGRRRDTPKPRPDVARRSPGAMIDAVTGLPTRQNFDSQLAELVARSTGPVALALFDFDHSRRMNGGAARPVRDDVMRVCARILRESSRDHDVVARFGPAELAVALPGTELPSALAVCQRMRQAIADYPWDTVLPGLTVTAAVGCVVGVSGARTHDMFARADLQLCARKDVG
jgi:diguanylate cyclase (GGDEF)-like protein